MYLLAAAYALASRLVDTPIQYQYDEERYVEAGRRCEYLIVYVL